MTTKVIPMAPNEVHNDVFDIDVFENVPAEQKSLLLNAFDIGGDGKVQLSDLLVAADMKKALQCEHSDEIQLKHFPQNVQETLKVFDQDGSGTVGTAELAVAAKMYSDSRAEAKKMRKYLGFAIGVIFMLLIANFGLTFACVELSKDIKVEDSGYMKTTNGDMMQILNAIEDSELELDSDNDDEFWDELTELIIEFDDCDSDEVECDSDDYDGTATRHLLGPGRNNKNKREKTVVKLPIKSKTSIKDKDGDSRRRLLAGSPEKKRKRKMKVSTDKGDFIIDGKKVSPADDKTVEELNKAISADPDMEVEMSRRHLLAGKETPLKTKSKKEPKRKKSKGPGKK